MNTFKTGDRVTRTTTPHKNEIGTVVGREDYYFNVDFDSGAKYLCYHEFIKPYKEKTMKRIAVVGSVIRAIAHEDHCFRTGELAVVDIELGCENRGCVYAKSLKSGGGQTLDLCDYDVVVFDKSLLKGKKFAVATPTKEKAKALLHALDGLGLRWHNGDNLTNQSYFWDEKENIAYAPIGWFGDSGVECQKASRYENNDPCRKIYNFEDVFVSPKPQYIDAKTLKCGDVVIMDGGEYVAVSTGGINSDRAFMGYNERLFLVCLSNDDSIYVSTGFLRLDRITEVVGKLTDLYTKKETR